MFTKDGQVKDIKTPKIVQEVWHNGEFIKWDDARVHVMSHVLHYGSSVFEGIRCYKTKRGPAIFRLREHMRRLLNSAKIYRMDTDLTLDQLSEAAIGLVNRGGLDQCYIRPIIFRSLDEERPAFGVNPFPNPLDCYIGAWDWGKYLGDEAIEQGVDVQVSTWNRLTPNSMPAMAKSGANYMNSQLIKMEALLNGFAEGIALDDRGFVSEGSGENIFMVHDGRVITPPLSSRYCPASRATASYRFAASLKLTSQSQASSAPRCTSRTSCSSRARQPKSRPYALWTAYRSAQAAAAKSRAAYRKSSSRLLRANAKRPARGSSTPTSTNSRTSLPPTTATTKRTSKSRMFPPSRTQTP